MEPLCASLIIGLHLATFHFERPNNYEEFNPGVYVMCDAPIVGEMAIGIYHNSSRSTSTYLGKVFTLGPIQILVGAVTGYPDNPLKPFIIPSVLLWEHARVSLIPPYKEQKGGITFAYQFSNLFGE